MHPVFFYNYTPALLYPRFETWGYTGLHLSVRPSVRPLKFFVNDFSTTMQATVVITGIQIDNNMLYLGTANQPSAIYSSLNFSDFLSFQTPNNVVFFFVKDFCETLQARVVIWYGSC